MKKVALLLLVVAAMFVIVGCPGGDEEETETTEEAVEETTTTSVEETTTTEAETTMPTEPGMTGRLVVALSAAEVVPPLDTGATGTAVFQISPDMSGIEYAVYTSGLEGVTAAHIHQGAAGENGPVLIWLHPPEQVPGDAGTEPMDGVMTTDDTAEVQGDLLVMGVLSQDALQAMETPMTVEQLAQLIFSGQTYVQVHTEANPAGALRGQITVPAMGGTTMTTGDEMMEGDDEEMMNEEMMEESAMEEATPGY